MPNEPADWHKYQLKLWCPKCQPSLLISGSKGENRDSVAGLPLRLRCAHGEFTMIEVSVTVSECEILEHAMPKRRLFMPCVRIHCSKELVKGEPAMYDTQKCQVSLAP